MSISPRLRIAALAGAAAGVTLIVALLSAGGAPQPQPLGLPDPGPITGWGLPILTVIAEVLGVLVVGALLVPLLSSTRGDGELAGRGVRAVASVRGLAGMWALVCLAELIFTYSDQFAIPLRHLKAGDVYAFAVQVDQGQALLVQAVLAVVVALASRWVTNLREVAWVLVGALASLVPPILTGHAAASGSHDTAIVSLLFHVLAVSLWCGGLAALWWFLGEVPKVRAVAVRRFSAIAAWCFGVVAVSGVINALVRLGGIGEFVTSDYGRAALVKIVILAGIGAVALRVRRTLGDGSATGVVAITAVELTLMAGAIGLGVALSRTPPPVGTPYTSAAESILGGPLPPAPSLTRVLWSFTPSGIGFAVVGMGLAAYLVGVLTLRRRGVAWSPLRTISWCVGLLAVAYATFGGLGTYSHVMFSAHMAAHMVLSMIAPILLVLGAPINLALRALPGTDADGGRGPRQWLAGVLRSRPVRLLTHPIVAAVIFVASLYGIYFTGAFTGLMDSHLGHAFMELHFLLAGCLYFEVLVGESPLPHRLSHFARLGLLLVVMPFHAFFAIAVMSADRVIGGSYYQLLDRPYATDLLHDQFVAGSLTWAVGEVPMVLVFVVLVGQWFVSDRREAQRFDRKAARDNDAEMTAYNDMLAALARHDQHSQ